MNMKIINARKNTLLKLSFFLLCCSSIALAESPTPATNHFKPISAYSAQYQLKSSKYKITTTANRQLSINKNNVASLEQDASLFFAKIDQKSSFLLSNDSCDTLAQSYNFHQTVFGKKKDYRIYFDYEKNKFIENTNKKENINDIQGKLYDELSYQEALRCALKNQVEVKIGQEFSYMVRTKGKNKNYTFVVSQLEKLDTAIGQINSVKLSRIRNSEKENNNSQIWFSKDHDYLLVKFRQEDDDDVYALDIKNLTLN